jgi:hypothetical protein
MNQQSRFSSRLTSPVVFALVLALLAASLGACVVHTADASPSPGPRAAAAERRADRRAERRDDRRDAMIDAQSPWDKLGERWVNGRADRDVIHVGRRDGRFRRLQLVVEHSALELYDVRVVFGDGSTYSPATRLVFAPGSTSRVIDLPGGARVIRRVEFRYGNLPGGGRAQVEVWGI